MLMYIGGLKMGRIWMENLPKLYDEKNKMNQLCHGLSSACKAFGTWACQETLREVRTSMGGLGFSDYALIGMLVRNCDVNQTYEGDNHVLLQQAGQMILRNLSWMMKGKSLLPTCEFLSMSDPNPEIYKGEFTLKTMIVMF